jgi:GntR family transcriptional regulator
LTVQQADDAVRGGPIGSKARSVYLSLRGELSSGTRPVGTLLPSEAKLAAAYGVGRVTVRRALAALASEGWVAARPGAGSVVTRPGAEPLAADISGVLPQLVEMSETTTARLLSFGYVPAPEPVAAALDLAPGEAVQRAVRVRLSEGRPFSHLTTHVPEALARGWDEADLASQPLFRLLERGGVRVASCAQSVTATAATPEVADPLGVAVGAPLLSLTRTVQDAEGRGVELLSALYRPDLFRLDMTLARVDASRWQPVIGGAP